MSGSLVATLVPLITSPINTRLYSPHHYGVWGIITAVATLLGILAFSHLPNTILLAKEEDEAKRALWLSVFFNATICFLFVIVLCVLLFFIKTGVLQWEFLHPLYLLIPVITFVNGLNVIIAVWANRKKQYKSISANRIIQICVGTGLQILLGLLIANETGIVVSQLVGACVGLWYFFIIFRKDIGPLYFNGPVFRKILKEYKDLIKFSLPADVINNFSNQIPVFFLERLVGTSAVGLYNMSNRILSLPVSYITSSISEVFRQKATRQYHDTGSCRPLVVRTAKTLFLVSIVPFLLCLWFAPDIFAFVFGAEWRQAGSYARLIGILFLFKTIFSPVSFVLFISKQFKVSFIMDVVVLITSMLSLYIGIVVFGSPEVALLLYACNYGLLYFVTFYLSYKYAVR